MPDHELAADPPSQRVDQSGAEPDPPPGSSSGRPGVDCPDDRPLLPDVTADERDVGWGDPYERDDDERYLREVPPHHGS